MKTLVLLSGGLDSATVLAACIAGGDECGAIAFDYGQQHKIELQRAHQIARRHYKVPFEIVQLDSLPLISDVVFAGRNLVMTSIAIAKAQQRGFDRIAVGCNATDWERFPDCRPQFWCALDDLAQAYGVTVLAPLIYHSKRDVAQAARKLGVPIELTWSCYAPQGDEPCGKCLACEVRSEALA